MTTTLSLVLGPNLFGRRFWHSDTYQDVFLQLEDPHSLIQLIAHWQVRDNKVISFQLVPFSIEIVKALQLPTLQVCPLTHNTLLLFETFPPYTEEIPPTTLADAVDRVHRALALGLDPSLEAVFFQRLMAIRVFLRNAGMKNWDEAPLYLHNHYVNPRAVEDESDDESLLYLGAAVQYLGPIIRKDCSYTTAAYGYGHPEPISPPRWAHWSLVSTEIPKVQALSAHCTLTRMGLPGVEFLNLLEQHAELYEDFS